MTYPSPPPNLKSLEQRIRNLEDDHTSSLRRQITMAMVAVGQMLPQGAVKGGTAMALRYGRAESRFTQDLDAARAVPLMDFLDDFEASLIQGWAGFTGRLVDRTPPRPAGVPPAYVMQPFDVKLDYLGRSWRTVKFELGHNEIDDVVDPELHIAPDLVDLFVELGLSAPQPIPVMRADHQVAQKLHAVSEPGSERARDLVDLQLLDMGENLDLAQVKASCSRLFAYRQRQAWPPVIGVGEQWDSLYAAATEGVGVLASVDDAVAWVNEFVRRVAAS
ncbi:nucleotidyl transferase AbiEii/AbiGii toxin family protein [Ruania rhizosphaerae]|uniref:nucleotidyl transferase AbiEii/AbiGii toxin family protein n=1 Tax=Ruania rhizosphaerae TaxID=1840413 RepID=UPI00190F9C83|nr:nucleotidyl transferase AbiEii/AbiGii toxin family protein [Ruania rhizosphaerae]